MKGFIKNNLIKVLNPLIKRLGYKENIAEGKDGLLENFYSILKTIEFDPKHIIDVGANRGLWTREALKYFPNACYTLLEPQKWLENSIRDILETNPKVSFNNLGAGSQAGTFKFTIADRDDSSSFRLTEREAKEHGLLQIEVPVVTLNEFIGQLGLPVPDIIKIDAEGLDLEVLKGSSDFFSKTEIFMVEAAVVCKDIDNTFLKVINYMDENGYSLFEITDLNRSPKLHVLWLTELVFIKKNGFIDSNKFAYNDMGYAAK